MSGSKARTGAVGAHRPPTAPVPVLVIDDQPAGATATVGMLAAAGYPTAVECDGDAVLRLVRAKLVRLAVSELYIPCAEGVCVVAALKRERARLPRLRVLVHSRHIADADDAWALAAGCDAVLHKPGSAGALEREVRRLDGTDPCEPGSSAGDQRVGP
jgi:CheY-like chemotaxis protein